MLKTYILLVLGPLPIIAYFLLLAAHLALVVRKRAVLDRTTILIDTLIVVAYGMMVSVYAAEAFFG